MGSEKESAARETLVAEEDTDQSTFPKLSLLRCSKLEMEIERAPTPPFRTNISVPFQWEETPGKPLSDGASIKPTTVQSLKLPPKLISELEVDKNPASDTVFDGPYVGRVVSCLSLYSRKIGSMDVDEFGFRRKSGDENGEYGKEDENALVVAVDGSGGKKAAETKVKISRIRRHNSLLDLHSVTSNFWVKCPKLL